VLGPAARVLVGEQDLAEDQAGDLDDDAAEVDDGDQADGEQAGVGQPGAGAELVDDQGRGADPASDAKSSSCRRGSCW
jgi:hypothetical protein